MSKVFDLTVVKKHPVGTAAVVLIGGALLFFVMRGGSASGGTIQQQTQAPDPNAIAVLQIQAGLAGQNSQQAFQLAYLQQQQQGDLAKTGLAFQLSEDTLAAQSTTSANQLAAQVALTKYTTDATQTLQLAGINAQLAINASNNTTFLQQQAQLAQEQEFSIAAQSQLQALISNNQTVVATTQINSNTTIAGINADVIKYQAAQNAAVAKAQASASKSNGLFGFLGAVVGAFL